MSQNNVVLSLSKTFLSKRKERTVLASSDKPISMQFVFDKGVHVITFESVGPCIIFRGAYTLHAAIKFVAKY